MSETRTWKIPQPPESALLSGEFEYRGNHVELRGRALRLVLWIAAHQARLNATSAENGYLSLSWKGESAQSIEGDLHVRL